MIKKQSLWFLTLFSLVLVMGVYYVTMPTDVIVNKQEETKVTPTVKVVENEYLTALKEEYEEERKQQKQKLETILNSSKSTTDEKNNAYLNIKQLTITKEEEENLQKQIKKEFELDSLVKIKESIIEVIVIKEKHDIKLANEIMRFIQKQYDTKKTISVEFKK